MSHRIFLIDDHPIARRGYASLIESADGFELAGETGTPENTREAIRENDPDLVLLDIGVEGMSGVDLIKQIGSHFPDLPVLVVSTRDELLYGERALHAGARGFVNKRASADTILTAIEHVADGGYYLSDGLESRVLQQYSGRDADVASPLDTLTDRELEIFERIGLGRSTREIAEELHISIKTVQTHRSNVQDKLGMDTIEELTRRAVLWTLEEG
jgi:DNA-binding NarL/FixJ family response regulator